MSLLEDGAYWRARADEVLAFANSVANPEAKRELLGIAEKYEWFASRADDRAAQRAFSRKP
jgi:hypothetical protein